MFEFFETCNQGSYKSENCDHLRNKIPTSVYFVLILMSEKVSTVFLAVWAYVLGEQMLFCFRLANGVYAFKQW